MTTEQVSDHKPQFEALAALTTRIAHDQHFANEFFTALDRKDEGQTVELAKQAVTAQSASSVAFHAAPSAEGICICYKGLCLCLIRQ